jgi:geranylgeranyl reductase family protein
MDITDHTPVDVLVVGAGPAGVSAAAAAARLGASVLLVEAKHEIGVPVRCAEYAPRLMAREVDVPDEAVAQPVDEMVVTIDDQTARGHRTLGRVRSPGFVLHREVLERALAASAQSAGAELTSGVRAAPASEGLVSLTSDDRTRHVRPRVIVCAEGPCPVFARARGRACLPAVQYTMVLASPLAEMRVHFSRTLRHGYAWVFPKRGVANVGLGCAPVEGRSRILPLLEEYVARLRGEGVLTGDPPVRRTAGWIPVWGPPESAVEARVLLAGDAAGFTDPVTGAGIWPAIATGGFAGRTAANAVKRDDLGLLAEYDRAWKGLFGGALERARKARSKMASAWESGELEGIVREVWPGL